MINSYSEDAYVFQKHVDWWLIIVKKDNLVINALKKLQSCFDVLCAFFFLKRTKE